jgi:hypothetical protein
MAAMHDSADWQTDRQPKLADTSADEAKLSD